MREFKSISASQISRHDECKRAWWFQYVMGLPVPQKASAALGEAMHAQLEKYLNDGTLPDVSTPAGRIAAPGLKYLPKPGTVFTEVPMSDKKKRDTDPDPDDPLPGNMPKLVVAGMPVNGFIDVLDLSGPHPVVIDHKSTSDLKWAKTEADLREDVQGTLYGLYALDVLAAMGVHADVVEFGHVVYLTKGAPTAKATRVTLTREHLASEIRNLETKVNEMKVTAQARTPASVEGNASACRNYGGCHFRDKCSALGMLENAAPTGLFKNIETVTPANDKKENTPVTTDPLAAIAALRAKKAAADAGQAPAAPAPTPVPVAAPTPAPTHTAAPAPAPANGAAASVLAKYGIKPATAATTTEAAPSIVPADAAPQGKVTLGAAPVAAPAPVAPPAVPTPSPLAAQDADAGKTVRKPRDHQSKLAALNWTTEQVGRMGAEAMRAAIDGNLDGRAYSVRPDGSIFVPSVGVLDTSTVPATEVEEEEEEAFAGHVGVPEAAPVAAPVEAPAPAPAPVAAPVEAPVAAPAPVSAPVAAPAPAPVAAPAPAPVAAPVQQHALVLYIDCAPDKGRDRDYILLEDYIQPLLPQVVDAYNRGCKRDDEKVPHYSLIPYARGPGFVAALVMSAPPVGIIVANTRFPATNAILEVLIPMADVVVRGTR